MTARSFRLTRRQLDSLFTALALPVLLMLLFVGLFGGAIRTGTGTGYVTYVLPGVLVLCAGFGAAITAVSVSQDMTGGIIDRFRSMDGRGPAILAGHVAASIARNIASTILVFGVACLIGFRPHASLPGWLAAVGPPLGVIPAVLWVPRPPWAGGQDPGGRQRVHVPRGVPAVREQRVRPGRHHARVDSGIRAQSAGHSGHPVSARAAAGNPRRHRTLGGAGLARRHPGRLASVLRGLVLPPHRLGHGPGVHPRACAGPAPPRRCAIPLCRTRKRGSPGRPACPGDPGP